MNYELDESMCLSLVLSIHFLVSNNYDHEFVNILQIKYSENRPYAQ